MIGNIEILKNRLSATEDDRKNEKDLNVKLKKDIDGYKVRIPQANEEAEKYKREKKGVKNAVTGVDVLKNTKNKEYSEELDALTKENKLLKEKLEQAIEDEKERLAKKALETSEDDFDDVIAMVCQPKLFGTDSNPPESNRASFKPSLFGTDTNPPGLNPAPFKPSLFGNSD